MGFIELVQKHHIAYHEKTLGQLFCDDSAQQIVDLLLAECHEGKVSIRLRSEVTQIEKTAEGFTLLVGGKTITASSVVDCQRRTFNARFRCHPFWL
ncbi:flavoprotein, HI0933 family [Proteus mirabilis]|uniref:Flavoprotein, HI0933 family n=1 Tax=Proteus mirabilis TaxID=584 RepID=A0A379GDR5_PROMI|nr:flavoprotein, HI0933 family [Proteus mirabilis]